MRRLILAFGLILGCEDEAPPPPPPAPVVAQDTGADEPEEDEEAAAKPERTAAEAAHDLLVAGDAAGALAAAKALEDKALGARLVEAAVLAGAPDDGAQPLLGLELKLAGGDAAGALSGALASIGDGTGDAAVLVARSVLAGAVVPEETTLPDGAEALVNWATARDANRARRFAAKADLVKGWRADHFRLDRAMAWKDSKGALGAADALAANGDPRAKLAGLLAKLDQIDNGTRRGVANSERAQWASTAQTIALAEGSLDQINKATNFAVDALKKANDFAGALDAATQSQTLALAAEVDGTSASLAVADAAILVGDPAKAIDVAAAVRAANPDATSEAHQQAAWTEGLGAWTLGRAEALDAAATGWKGLNAALGLGDRHGIPLGWGEAPALAEGAIQGQVSPDGDGLLAMHGRFIAAMDDDLNTSGALAVLFDLAKPLRALANRLDRGDNSDLPAEELQDLCPRWHLLRELAAALGLRWEQEPTRSDADDDAEIEAAVEARRAAKASKNYSEADRIRDELLQRGIELIDRPGGVTDWIRS